MYLKYEEFQMKHLIDNNKIFNRCPAPNCKFIYEWNGEKEGQKFKCTLCDKTYCIMCKVPWHENVTCKAYRESKGMPADEIAFAAYLKGQGVGTQKCPKCGVYVSKTAGCNHMTCRCKYQFCYVCLKQYRSCMH